VAAWAGVRGRRPAAAGVLAAGLVAAVALAALGLRASAGLAPADLRRILDDHLREREAALRSRLTTLARLPRLAAAVSTDARTVADLTEEELGLRPLPGETLALGQIPRTGAPVPLRVLPPQHRAPPLDLRGPRVWLSGDQLMLTDAVPVRPLDRAEELQGVLAASWRVDTEALVGPVRAAKAAAWLQGDAAALSLVETPGARRGPQTVLPLQSPSGQTLRLVLAIPARHPAASLTPAAAVALATVLLGWLLLRRRPSPTPPSPPSPPVTETAPLAPPPPLPPLWAGSTPDPSARSRIDRYEILKLLDAGGMAEVYLARVTGEPGFEKLVALKVLQSALAREPEVVELFLDEARLASHLHHPNIVQVLDVGRGQDQYFIAMEYVDGADLDRLRSSCRRAGALIPVPVVLAVLRRICDGLQSAHTAVAADGTPLGLIHRDVKSANVLVGRTGAVKIGDFGIARAAVLRRRGTDLGVVRGTPGYMAPEQRLGQIVDQRTDVFGVGAIAYELLSGAPLDLDPLALGAQGWPHVRQPSVLRRDLPVELDAIVFRALAFDREERYQSCAELECALEEVATHHPPIGTDKTIAAWVASALE
jgi:hypothetical protein